MRRPNVLATILFAAVVMLVSSTAAVAPLALAMQIASYPALAQSTPADRFDVLGVKINMPLIDARKLLGSALAQPVTEECDSITAYQGGPTLRTRCVLHDGRPTVDRAPNMVSAVVIGEEGPGWFHMTEQVDLDLTGENGNEKVIFVSRGKRFPKGQEATIDKVVEGLKQKYGETTTSETRNQYGVLMKWYFDPQGQLIPGQTPHWRFECDAATKANNIDGSEPSSFGTALAHPTPREVIAPSTYIYLLAFSRAKPDAEQFQGCGFSIVAEVSATQNPQIASSFRIMMVDQSVFYDALVNRETYFNVALQAKQNSDAKKAKGDVKY